MISIIAFSGAEIVQGLNFALLLATPVLIIVSLLKLRKIVLPAQTKALWAVIILVIPIIGALAFLIVKPGNSANQI
ncbi:MAG: PLDc N-terminal domain-containing protein [Bellilinea sp.]